jgi:hypothetical protein
MGLWSDLGNLFGAIADLLDPLPLEEPAGHDPACPCIEYARMMAARDDGPPKVDTR